MTSIQQQIQDADIRKLKDIFRKRHHEELEVLVVVKEHLAESLTNLRDYLKQDDIDKDTLDNLEDRVASLKQTYRYHTDMVSYLVSLRQRKLKNALKYHKFMEHYERCTIEVFVEGGYEQFNIHKADEGGKKVETEAVKGESEQTRRGCQEFMERQQERKKVLTSLLRRGYYFQ